MTAVGAELLAVVERSPAAGAAHDREAWVDLFTADGRVVDPYGSRPHVGRDQIGRFYDTFIGPRQIIFHRDFDAVAGATVVRDLMLEIVMSARVSLDVPMHLRYDLRDSRGEWRIERLCAHWELPVMVMEMLGRGAKALPPAIQLGAGLIRNQGLAGTVGFVSGFRRPRRRDKRCVEALLDAVMAGDQMTARRALHHDAPVSMGDAPVTIGELVEHLRGGRRSTVIAAGDTVSASVSTPSGRGVMFCELAGAAGAIARIRYFG